MAATTQPPDITPRSRASPRRSLSGPAAASAVGASTQAARVPVCKLLHEDPELAAAVPQPRRKEAVDRCTVSVMTIKTGSGMAAALLRPGHGMGVLILDGVLARRVWVDGRSGAELLGEGDLLGPIMGAERWMLPVRTGWSILAPLRVAMLDSRFVENQLRRYPELALALAARATQKRLRSEGGSAASISVPDPSQQIAHPEDGAEDRMLTRPQLIHATPQNSEPAESCRIHRQHRCMTPPGTTRAPVIAASEGHRRQRRHREPHRRRSLALVMRDRGAHGHRSGCMGGGA